jgi:hypothetical protein
VGANGLGDRGPRDLAAARASTGLGLVFGELRSQLGQLGHWVPHERQILRATCLRQRLVAVLTLLGHVRYRALDPLGRQQDLEVRRVPWLPARLFAAPLLGRSLGQRGTWTRR